MSEELKPCPFCGKQPESRWMQSGGEPGSADDCGFWSIDCCHAQSHADDEKEAAASWNRRAAPEPAPGDVERAEAFAERIYQLRDHNFILSADKGGDCYRETCDCIARDFAALLSTVRAEATAQERARCAKVCDDLPTDKARCAELQLTEQAWDEATERCAAAIRGSK